MYNPLEILGIILIIVFGLAFVITMIQLIIEFWASFFEQERTERRRRQHDEVLKLHYKYIKDQNVVLSDSEYNFLKRHKQNEKEL